METTLTGSFGRKSSSRRLACPLCGGSLRAARTADYEQCSQCAHEALVQGDVQSHIINDDLKGGQTALKKTGLDRFHSLVIDQVAEQKGLLLDVGCGSGRFLALNRGRFHRAVGIEVTPECIDFARTKLNLEVHQSIPASLGNASVITMWHSLEHIPLTVLPALCESVTKVTDPQTRLVVSVPCNDGLQYRWFRNRFAYYDVPSHVSQFSRASLTKLLAGHGWVQDQEFFSTSYVWFGYLQGFLNFFNRIHNYFYYRLKRGQTFGLSRFRLAVADAANFVGAALALPLTLPFCLIEKLWPSQRSVVTLVFRSQLPA